MAVRPREGTGEARGDGGCLGRPRGYRRGGPGEVPASPHHSWQKRIPTKPGS